VFSALEDCDWKNFDFWKRLVMGVFWCVCEMPRLSVGF